MMPSFQELWPAGLGLVVGLFLIILAILWFILPFSIFGIKPKLNQLLVETKRINESLKSIKGDVQISKSSLNDKE